MVESGGGPLGLRLPLPCLRVKCPLRSDVDDVTDETEPFRERRDCSPEFGRFPSPSEELLVLLPRLGRVSSVSSFKSCSRPYRASTCDMYGLNQAASTV